jgi:serine/threonine-protein kinase RsbT
VKKHELDKNILETSSPGSNLVDVEINTDADIVTARQEARELAKHLEFSSSELAVIAAAISELARNIVSYAHKGTISFGIITEHRKKGFLVIARDSGPGIANVKLAMQQGYSTSNSLGLGLPGVKRLMDTFEISSQLGTGTSVIIKKWIS